MIGVDTNILVRVVLEDDPKEALLAKSFLQKAVKNKQLFVSSYTLLELAWVLKTKKRSREEICSAILTLVDSPGIVIGQKAVVLRALEEYTKGKADFGDYFILSEGLSHNVPRLVSFDKEFINNDSRCFHPAEF